MQLYHLFAHLCPLISNLLIALLSISPPPPNAATLPIATPDTMSPYWYALRLIQAFEDRIVESVSAQLLFR